MILYVIQRDDQVDKSLVNIVWPGVLAPGLSFIRHS